jgi:hypothetical protein
VTVMLHEQKPPLDEALLVHYGVKGMHWGIRNEQSSSGRSSSGRKQPRFTPEQKARAKKVAIGAGALAVAAGAAYIAYRMNKSGNIPLSSLKATTSAKKVVRDLTEQTDIIHSSRTKNKGFHFVRTGGLPDPLHAYESAFGQDSGGRNMFKKLADGRVAAIFDDPEGRVDHAGRKIPHEVVVPKSMAEGINSMDDIKAKIWPIIKPTYDDVYAKTLNRP